MSDADKISRELSSRFGVGQGPRALRMLMTRVGRIPFIKKIPFLRTIKKRLVDPFLATRGGTTRRSLERNPFAAEVENKHDIVCLPIIEWDFRFQRPQQLMTRFGAAGHRVFYLRHQFRPFGAPWKITKKAPNVYEVSLRGPAVDLYREPLKIDRLFRSLDALRRDLNLGATATFVQLPSWWPLAKKARDAFGWPVIYDCMDDHAGFGDAAAPLLEQERELLASADLVVVSSAQLENNAREHAKNVVVVRNACDYEHFAIDSTAKNVRPLIGYYGAIADWFDSELVAQLARRRPDWDFVLVGSTYKANLGRLAELPNVSLPGEQPYDAIPHWLARFDVAIIPFKRTSLTEATNPVKVYEMLAGGKPVVSVPIPEVAALAPLVRLAENADEFEREIEAALGEGGGRRAEGGREFAREQTWARRAEQLERATASAFPRVSIVIVTYNNKDINQLCLETLFGRMEWPNFEVIIVDNASANGTVELLREAERTYSNLRVLYNDRNLGFAPANNIGLRLATGEFLVLLNNDTVLPRGWFSALARHLVARPSIGMIGPVSNAVGNEAKIDVGYTDVRDMPAWAAKYVRAHDGETFPIPMLGMFCVAMRRAVFERVGFLDERFVIGMFEDDDYSRRLRDLGYELVCARDAFVHHWQKASFRLLGGDDEYDRIFEENRRRYREKWGEDAHAP
ncbi:MAG TPA: glycosyltransferase [Thermoanaerobaculia bacterium]|nr:glycosyltransferase [Thermoanaerobaculia bacterium]